MWVLAAVTDEEILDACRVSAEDGINGVGLACRSVYRWTENEFLALASDWLLERPLRIVLILLGAFVVSRLARRAITRFVDQISDDGLDRTRARIRGLTPRALQASGQVSSLRSAARAQTIGLVLKNAASVVIYSVAVLMILSELGLELAPLIAGAGIAGVALGFGAQSLVKDFLAGLFILAEDQYGVGDVIDAGEAFGEVEAVNLRITKLRGIDGTVWYVPNGVILRVGNMSQQWARALLDLDVAYDTDLDVAQRVVKEVADELWRDEVWSHRILEEPDLVGIQAFGPDSVTVRLLIKTLPGEQWNVARQFRLRLKARFDAEGIEIPFPQRTVWVRREQGSSRAVDGDPPID